MNFKIKPINSDYKGAVILININVSIEMGNFVMKIRHNKIPCMLCELTDIQQFSTTLPQISNLKAHNKHSHWSQASL